VGNEQSDEYVIWFYSDVCVAILYLFLCRDMTFLSNFITFNHQEDTCHFHQIQLIVNVF